MKRTKAQVQQELEETRVQLAQAMETVRMLKCLAKGEEPPVDGQAGDWIPARVAVLVGAPTEAQLRRGWAPTNVRIKVRLPATEFDVVGIKLEDGRLRLPRTGSGLNCVQARGEFFKALKSRAMRANPATCFAKAEWVQLDMDTADTHVPADAGVPVGTVLPPVIG